MSVNVGVDPAALAGANLGFVVDMGNRAVAEDGVQGNAGIGTSSILNTVDGGAAEATQPRVTIVEHHQQVGADERAENSDRGGSMSHTWLNQKPHRRNSIGPSHRLQGAAATKATELTEGVEMDAEPNGRAVKRRASMADVPWS